MTQQEFTTWTGTHGELFPSFGKAINGLPIETMKAWAERFTNISLASAQVASKQLMSHSTQTLYKVEDHIQAIIQTCQAQVPRVQPREQRVKCKHCLDVGFVPIYSPEFVAAVLTGKGDMQREFMYAETMAQCRCKVDEHDKRDFLRYDEDRQCCIARNPIQYDEAVAAVKAWDQSRSKRTDDRSEDFFERVGAYDG